MEETIPPIIGTAMRCMISEPVPWAQRIWHEARHDGHHRHHLGADPVDRAHHDRTRLFVGHDYGTDDRDAPMWEAAVAEHVASNKHVSQGTTKDAFVRTREERDATLSLPDRMLHALQVNLRGGALPVPEADGHSYFKIPANRF